MKEAHRLSNLVPAMTDEEFGALVQDIAAHGLLEPITLYEGKVLDGRHRDRACEKAEVAPRYEQYDGDEPARFVISRNLHRRHLTVAQRAVLAADALPELEKEARKRQGTRADLHKTSVSGDTKVDPTGKQGRAATEAGELYGISGSTVGRAKRIKAEDPGLFERVKAGEIAVETAIKELRRSENGASRETTRQRPSLDTERGQMVAKAHCRKLEKLDAQLAGMARGAKESVDIFMASAVMSADEVRATHDSIGGSLGLLRKFNASLKEAAAE